MNCSQRSYGMHLRLGLSSLKFCVAGIIRKEFHGSYCNMLRMITASVLCQSLILVKFCIVHCARQVPLALMIFDYLYQ